MEFEEYPKAMYRQEGEYRTVADEADEIAALDDGWRVTVEAQPVRRGRPPKSKDSE